MTTVQPLEADVLYTHTDIDKFDFQTTDDLSELALAIGQPRAVEALRFGVSIRQEGYNVFALGPSGTGKRSMIRRYFEENAANEPVPSDWCYVYNFKERNRPCAIQLPPGRGRAFRDDMDNLVEELRSSLSSAFESDEYRTRRQVLEQEFQGEQEKSLEGLQERARHRNLALLRTPGGLVFAPMRSGDVISPEELQSMSDEERKELEKTIEEFQAELQQIVQKVPQIQRQIRERLKELNRSFINYAVGDIISDLRQRYAEFPEVIDYLHEVEEDVIQNANDFLAGDDDEQAGGGQNPMAALMARARAAQQNPLQRYRVNLLVDNSALQGAPVIYENNPTFQNLTGQLEHQAQMGALVTDFTLIKPGALHRANGGYLILDARKVLMQPYAWEALKRALQSCTLRIESIAQMLSVISTVSLEPEPIPLSVKVGFYGDRLLYYLLSQHDPEFLELFKVQADFDEVMDRSQDNQSLYACLIARLVRENNLRPFDRSAVARVIEHSARLVGDSEKLSAEVQSVANLLREADYWAGVSYDQEPSRQDGSQNGSQNGVVTAADVQKAIDQQVYRSDRLRERVHETILRDIFLIDTQGEKVGQVNGLSVLTLGSFSFGRPSRITASIRFGKGEVVNIEREVDMSGPIHSKGVLILSGFLGSRYAVDRPLSLSASLVFEQSYSGVEGDSASSAELYALLSAIARVPIRQNFAVTGAVNQHGQVQAIGGANEKIEGFFDVCKARGLTGDQGVLIPRANIKHLMVRQDVIDAVREGKFAIYPIDNVDQGIELLTGIPAGEPGEDGLYPPDSINGLVHARLKELAEKAEQLGKADEEKNHKEDAV
jgi:lon-related putative ATP-dependent protease